MADDADQRAAFAAFVRAHGRSLYGTALLLTGRANDAEDLVQDTLAHLYPKWERVCAAEAPVAYVRRTLANRFVSTRRRPGATDLAIWDLPDGPAPGDVAEVVADRGMLCHLLGDLPERQRAALVMRYFHDLPDEEIAAALDCRAVTVRSLVSRGIATMRRSCELQGTGMRGEQR